MEQQLNNQTSPLPRAITLISYWLKFGGYRFGNERISVILIR
jgi:hypothetical protein